MPIFLNYKRQIIKLKYRNNYRGNRKKGSYFHSYVQENLTALLISSKQFRVLTELSLDINKYSSKSFRIPLLFKLQCKLFNFINHYYMKYVSSFIEAIRQTLHEMYLNHPKPRCRQRAQAILLNAEGFNIPKLVEIFPVRRNAISDWIDRWEKYGLMGLYDLPCSGRTPIYNAQEVERLKAITDEEPRKIKRTQAKMEEETGKKASIFTIKRALKKSMAISGNVAGDH